MLRLEGAGLVHPGGAAGGTEALRGLSMTLPEGEVTALLGPSGCGKSSALRLIAGLAAPTSGRVVWPGGAPRPGDLGAVFQDPTLMPWATARRNVWLPLRLRGVSERAARPRVEEALARVGLKGFEDAHPRALSGGMRMRVSIARALVTRPRMLLMDEPFGALDEITRHALGSDLLRIVSEVRCTVLFVTHSVSEAVYLASRVLVMTPRPGRIADVVAVAEPTPRDPPWRTSAAHAALSRRVSEALQAAMGLPEAAA